MQMTSGRLVHAIPCIAFLLFAGTLGALGVALSGQRTSSPPTAPAPVYPHSPSPPPLLPPGRNVLGMNLILLDGLQETDALRRQTTTLQECLNTTLQNLSATPVDVVVREASGSFYDHDNRRIVLSVNDTHESLLVHEFVHFLESERAPNEGLVCAQDLHCEYSKLEQHSSEWGDGNGFPYAYSGDFTAREYLATLFEGWCVCGDTACGSGPSRAYLQNESNPFALRQFICMQELVVDL